MIGANYYQLLSVRRDASRAEIRQAYVRLVKHIHPDLAGPDWRPHARLQDLQRAYHCLLDPDARQAHDAALDEQDSAHIARLQRVQRRLTRRARSRRGVYRSGGQAGASRWRRLNWRLIGVIILAAAVIAKLRSGGAVI